MINWFAERGEAVVELLLSKCDVRKVYRFSPNDVKNKRNRYIGIARACYYIKRNINRILLTV